MDLIKRFLTFVGLRKDNIQNETKGEEEVEYENASIENEVPKTISLPTNNENSVSEDVSKEETVKETSVPKKKRKREIIPDSQETASLPPKRSRTKSTRLKDFVDLEQQSTRKKSEMIITDSPIRLDDAKATTDHEGKSEELESTKENPKDPFVLVGAAHCNFICKDRDTGNILETCCCRNEKSTATCNSEVNYC